MNSVRNKTELIVTEEAWSLYPGPILLLAGPGTGKTYQLAMRIRDLVKNKSVLPEEIAVMTFTNEAAQSMITKLNDEGSQEYLEADKHPERISTMHSLGYQIIKENPERVGLKEDFIVNTEDKLQEVLMQDAAALLEYSPEKAFETLELRRKAKKIVGYHKNILDKYEKILRSCNAIDYDDQILLACKILKEDKNLRKKYKVPYLLIDEYQDINAAQFEFIKLLSEGNTAGLFVVGDDDQSIYSFRGGSPEFIKSFVEDFKPNARVISMEISRRCPKAIMTSALSVVETFNKDRIKEKIPLRYLKKEVGEVIVHNCPSDDKEARLIAGEVNSSKSTKSIFILVPNRFYMTKIKQAFRSRGIKFDATVNLKNTGLQKIKFIKDWIRHPTNNLFTRLCIDVIIEAGTTSIPSSRIKKPEQVKLRNKGLAELAILWGPVVNKQKTYFESLKEAGSNGSSIAKEFLNILDGLSNTNQSLTEFLTNLIKNSKVWKDQEDFFQEIEGLYEEMQIRGKPTENYGVRVLTMQGAKGLQADIVFVIGLEDGNFPRALLKNGKAEEARLLFVSMTRAKKELHLMHCRKRDASVSHRPYSYNLNPSEFLKFLPKDLAEDKYHVSRS